MGLFGRKRPVDGATNGHGPAPRASHESRSNHQKEKFDIDSGHYNRRPSFGQWLKMTWLDVVTMIIMGAIGLGVYHARPAPSRSFPVYFQDGEVVYPEFAYPLRKEIVPIWAAALLAALVPIVVFLFMQIRIKSFWDVNNAAIGLLYSLITAAVFQVFLKWLIGGLRPHFLAVCRPNILPGQVTGNGYREIMYDRKICTGDDKQINDSLESFPSGHSTAAWAGFAFLYFYLNAKLKVFSNHHPAMWKLVALYTPLLGATLISGALTIDEFHNWYDVVAGAIIGSVMALSAYRMVYASVWDFRFNHIPLTRHTPFAYGGGAPGAGGFESAVWTHKAGWGHEEALGGAPFDAAHGMRGAFGNATGLRNGRGETGSQA
ncbi:hypothetical protein GJ744_012084 [Endocarpon pusillum]|uniref:Phosphatidic acid phosphatase type 2/haloperoxidase domain-containing protein n=1 Tax=Endocarpon pusillum TaxID=364733 RepID=A0A8H7E4E9_9EURO|nr:hypothetical protein GJ744_012084 [Endocarpon pusillum]